MNERQKEGSHTKNKVYRSISARRSGNRPPPIPPPFLLHYTARKYTGLQPAQQELQLSLRKYVKIQGDSKLLSGFPWPKMFERHAC
jgi:hypothetical protein